MIKMDQIKLNTIKIIDDQILESDKFLNELEEKYPQGINIEKSGLRKQIDILKSTLTKVNYETIETSIYHLKVSLLKVIYLILRRGASDYLNNFKKFLETKTKEFIQDLITIEQNNFNNKRLVVNKAVKVYKDFLNAIIIKSYIPSYETNQKNQIQNQRPNRPPHRSW